MYYTYFLNRFYHIYISILFDVKFFFTDKFFMETSDSLRGVQLHPIHKEIIDMIQPVFNMGYTIDEVDPVCFDMAIEFLVNFVEQRIKGEMCSRR